MAELQKVNALLQQELTERKQIEQRKASLEQVRNALWHMSSSQDIDQVLQALYHELRILCPAVDACSVQVVDKDKGDGVSYQISERQVHEIYAGSVAGTPVGACWREQRPIYRPDLRKEDLYEEAGLIWDEQCGYTSTVRSVLDVPFQQGTLAVNSTEPDAFSQRDIEILQEMAQILTEGFVRFEDLRALEQRNRELEDEIVERKQVEESLRASEEHYRTLIERLPIGIVGNKPDGSMPVYYNPKAREILGLDEDDIPQRTPENAYVDFQDREELLSHLQNDGFHKYEYWLKRKDGIPVLVRGISVAIYDAQGRPTRYEGYMEDITERKRSEERQQLLQRVREDVWKMKGGEDIDQILSTIGPTLTAREISFLAYAINLVVAPEGEHPVHVYIHDPDGNQFLAPLRRDQAETHIILEAWKSGEVLYRPDLAKENLYGEHLAPPQQPHHARVRSAIDVPFSRGTLSLASARLCALSEEDVSFLKDLAQVIEGGFQRAEDLQRLEQRNRELEWEITERKQAEAQVLRQSTLLDAINRVFREALMCETGAEVAHTCLIVAEELTGSKFGFIGELNPAGRFDTLAISNPGWDACTMPDSEATRLIKDMEIRGVDRSTLREGKSRIVNDPASHPDRVGTPEGHPPVISFLGVPLKQADKTIGMIGLANKESDYNLIDQENVESLAGAFVEALNRKQAEEVQRQTNRLLRTFSQINQALVRSIDVPTLMQDMCRIIVEEGGYRLAWVGLAEQDPDKSVRPVAQWGFEEGYLDTLNLTWADTERGRGPTGTAIRTGQLSLIQHLQTDSTFEPWRAEAEQRGYTATIALPLLTDEQCLGALNIYAYELDAFGGEEVELLEELAADLAYGITALRVRTEHQQFEEDLRIDIARQRIRSEILQMQSEQDWEKVVLAFHEELKKLVRFNACSINLIDLEESKLIAYAVGPQRGVHQNIRDVIPPALKKALATGQCVYRSTRADPLFVGNLPPEIHSVVDMPFTGGTIALNSTEEHAFSSRSLMILERFALVISEANRRLEDLKALVESEERFRQAQKMEAIGQLAGGVAHDFNNLLTIITGYSQLLLKKLEPGAPQYAEIKEIRQAADRGQTLIQQLLAFSRKQTVNPGIIDLNILVADMEKMFHRLLGEDVELSLEFAPSLGQVFADEGQIQQVLMNLAVNARDAMPDGGRLIIETANVELKESDHHPRVVVKPGSYVLLNVSDTGVGMDDETREHIFEPFFTTKETGKGTGLGLAMVYGIVKQSEGYIWVYSEPGQGTMFRIYLPRVDTEGIQEDLKEERDTVPSRGAETILVVEDDGSLRQLVSLTLNEQGYTVLEAENGRDAIQVPEQHGSTIHLLLTDVIMPEMNGRELANALTPLHPDMKVIYMSGYSEGIVDRHGVLDPGTFFLPKPFDPDNLAQKVREVLDSN